MVKNIIMGLEEGLQKLQREHQNMTPDEAAEYDRERATEAEQGTGMTFGTFGPQSGIAAELRRRADALDRWADILGSPLRCSQQGPMGPTILRRPRSRGRRPAGRPAGARQRTTTSSARGDPDPAGGDDPHPPHSSARIGTTVSVLNARRARLTFACLGAGERGEARP